MFKFFPDDNDKNKDGDNQEGEEGVKKLTEIRFNQCKEILISDFHSSLLSLLTNGGGGEDNNVTDVKVWSGRSLKCVNLGRLGGIMEKVSKDGEDEKVQGILKSSTDLVPGEYEGGFKTWECTFDLITYLQDNSEEIFRGRSQPGGDKKPLRILDMGCGSGLVGLAVLSLAEVMGVEVTIDFQDYNEEVINYVTIPNTLLNFQDEMASRCRFFSGDWDSFKEVIIGCHHHQEGSPEKNKADNNLKLGEDERLYDLILSSETIYNLDYFPKFLRVVKSCLRKDEGCLYLAAKTFYFGVGGGTKAFLNMVNEDDRLQGSVVHVIKHGVQREIIRCQCRSTTT